jgi:hydroxymethylpyrimidine/phosphomethylpyrimidine kinase
MSQPPSNSQRGRVLIIAGSDSGGGAGIQADIKTVSALGGFAMTAVTAITVQNTLGVSAVHGVPLEIVSAQVQAVMDDLGADAIKTGMLGTAATVETVAATIDAHGAGVPTIVDPVMVAKGGHPLLEDIAIGAVRSLMLPRAFLVTPNAPEAEALSGVSVDDLDGQKRGRPICCGSARRPLWSKAATSPAKSSAMCWRRRPVLSSLKAAGSTPAPPTARAAPWPPRSPL